MLCWVSPGSAWSFPWTLLCCVKCWLGLQESVELAGDVADQAAFDLAVGLALGAASLRVGAGGWVISQPGQDDDVERLVELTVPARLRRTRTVWPLEAGIGAAPPSMAKAASLGSGQGATKHGVPWRPRSGRRQSE
jgi:hypothetical protein